MVQCISPSLEPFRFLFLFLWFSFLLLLLFIYLFIFLSLSPPGKKYWQELIGQQISQEEGFLEATKPEPTQNVQCIWRESCPMGLAQNLTFGPISYCEIVGTFNMDLDPLHFPLKWRVSPSWQDLFEKYISRVKNVTAHNLTQYQS